jgi:hypothetical protein
MCDLIIEGVLKEAQNDDKSVVYKDCKRITTAHRKEQSKGYG